MGIIPFRFLKDLSALSVSNVWKSWKLTARFVVPIMAKCTYFDCTDISISILTDLHSYQVKIVLSSSWSQMNTEVRMPNKTANSAQVTYLELHTCYSYENAESCNPTAGSVTVKVFTVRHLSDIRSGDIFKVQVINYESNCSHCSVKILHYIIRFT